jgi:ubiquinone/menaquinone biosynthesis C-methylase UbiE
MARDRSVKYHNRVARKYDAIYDDAYWLFHDEVTWRHVKPHLPRDLSAKCLDLGCGTGKWGLKLLKSGYRTTLLDHAPAMIGEVRAKLDEAGWTDRGEAVVGDIVYMPQLPEAAFMLTLAMGDPLSICSDPQRAANEMFRLSAPGGVVIATADSRTAALSHYLDRGEVGELARFVRSGRTHWLTRDSAEQFNLHTFTPQSLRKLFERSGFEVLHVVGKPVLPVRSYREMLDDPSARRELVEIEMELAADSSTASSANHLQITAKRA